MNTDKKPSFEDLGRAGLQGQCGRHAGLAGAGNGLFTAPASTRHHGAYPGGLLEHSLNVYHRLRAIVCVETYGTTTSDLLAEDVEETVAVLALLHDVCKVNCYHVETKRRKNPETGRWEDFQGYAFKDPLPLGHGEKACS